MKPCRPMLAARIKKETDIIFPVYASYKLDGVRALVFEGRVYSRTLKLIPNLRVQALFGVEEYEGFDGELISGEPNDKDVYRNTYSVTARETATEPVSYYIFDRVSMAPFSERKNVSTLTHTLIHDLSTLLHFEKVAIEQGYEGVILRSPNAPYKHNRSTLREQGMMKLKRFIDSEAEIIEAIELMRNYNEAELDERGYMKRSQALAGKIGAGIMGALRVRDLITKVEFEIGTGFTQKEREELWNAGEIVRYKHFPSGVKDRPRFPVYLGRREAWDI